MPSYKRASSLFFSIANDELLNVMSVLRGGFEVSTVIKLFALSPLTASKHAVSSADLDILLQIPEERWSTEEELVSRGAKAQRLEEMARAGLLVSDQSDPDLSRLRHRATVLDSNNWHPYAALYHFMTRSAEYHYPFEYGLAEAEAEARAKRFVAEHGAPPDSYHTLPDLPQIELPSVEKNGELYELLRRRKTSRAFDTDRKMSVKDLATLLYYTYGCHGYTYLSPEVLLLHRTSPSGGSRHPVEVYLLVLRVDGLAPGLYHYNMCDHVLEKMEEVDLEQAQGLAVEFGGGQDHMKTAHVIFIMTARYHRNYWKYQRISKTYGVVLMDVAHLSQTLYLIATDLNLGALFSTAINSPRIDEVLGLDGYEEGALAIFVCGAKPEEGESDYSLNFRPFFPGKSELKY